MITKQVVLTDSIRKEVVEEFVARLVKDYVFPELAKEIGIEIVSKLQNGDYDTINDAEAFSKALTDDIQTVSKDRHLRVTVTAEEKVVENKVSEKEMMEEYYGISKANNYGFFKIERLPGNIGYIELRNFEDPTTAGETATHAMNFVANTEALIFDLRKNGGGSPGMVALLTTYLFEQPVHLNNFYTRAGDRTIQSWTLPHVPGKRFVNKPVHILTSNYTFSAAEEFTYNLINLKRATVIGEVTGGGANPGAMQQLTKHFRAFIPTGRAINPITRTNWEGTGVQPDIETEKDKAFDCAYQLALRHVRNVYQNQEGYGFMLKEIDQQLES
ncbi:hypothetical protein DS745_22365 [Anaerobacillus alkaliphilus]|uniref:Tail specific protease domain-containing protein n=1 Tax=Anaerobacillus alkaliphilus TaxID=1548597 RepID=A0A4Q0VM11_9BACI|nr:S41 family peptidase [Anaerobacillus alkaliphilus]RXI96457.1 hypothetical protein DS745_22365 [Anaerobacillus alkaliphilus]